MQTFYPVVSFSEVPKRKVPYFKPSVITNLLVIWILCKYKKNPDIRFPFPFFQCKKVVLSMLAFHNIFIKGSQIEWLILLRWCSILNGAIKLFVYLPTPLAVNKELPFVYLNPERILMTVITIKTFQWVPVC